jgi:hypothetical protein
MISTMSIRLQEEFVGIRCFQMTGMILRHGRSQAVSHSCCPTPTGLFTTLCVDLGGENAPDFFRGPYNEGGWWFERVGKQLILSHTDI